MHASSCATPVNVDLVTKRCPSPAVVEELHLRPLVIKALRSLLSACVSAVLLLTVAATLATKDVVLASARLLSA